jgi:uncharacterized protein (DUF39 family)
MTTTQSNRERVAGRRQAIDLIADLKQMDREYVRGFLEIFKGALDELASKLEEPK